MHGPSESRRPERVAALIQRELADLIRRELDDPRVRVVTLTRVDISKDLRNARVWFTLTGKLSGADATTAIASATRVLRRAAGHLRHELAGRMDLRVVPVLDFRFDESAERGARIGELLGQISREDK